MAMPSTNPPKTSENLFGKALREALLAGVISLGLFTLYIGLKTDQNIRNELILTQRWGMLVSFSSLTHSKANPPSEGQSIHLLEWPL